MPHRQGLARSLHLTRCNAQSVQVAAKSLPFYKDFVWAAPVSDRTHSPCPIPIGGAISQLPTFRNHDAKLSNKKQTK